ncbi:DUF3857 domain-containing protein [Flavobacterium sp.]|uniref:DUF3857 domain-containing protein n=1 Tax=Flavobacterium sp. TaxID=239 RepID=UPI002FDE56CD
MKKILSLTFFLFSISIFSQENLFAVFPDSIKQNANAVVKNEKTEIIISSYKNMTIKKYRVITILNELGLKNMDTFEYFDKSTSIKDLEVQIFNAFGSEIKKFKKKDFKENSVSEGSIITDNKVLYLDYTPIQYPFTVVYKSEISTSNTAFIPSWFPIQTYFLSVLSSSVKLSFTPDVNFKYKEFNFNNTVVKEEKPGSISYSVQNIKALRREELVPSLQKIVPYVMFGLNKFQIEGVEGNAESWGSFGKWINDKLLSDTEEIPQETLIELKKIIGNETDILKKAKIIYEFVQNKTRYVSIQLGIGGWKPMLAKNVDRLGYGDCKGLTNYTRSLLKAFNIPSYYAIVYGDEQKRDIVEDFVSMQGNHAILGIPDSNSIIWLECTSQTLPFGFQGDFTDDRKVLIVDGDNSKIVKTKSYLNDSNYQKTTSKVIINNDNSIQCEVLISSKGIIYDNKYRLKNESSAKVKEYYIDFFNTINNKEFTKTEITDDKQKLEVTEVINFVAKDFIKNSGGKIVFPVNCINQVSFVPKKYEERKIPFQVDRGYCYEDILFIQIPDNLKVDSLPKDQKIGSEFGNYDSKFEIINNELIFKRKIQINEGFYTADKYENYRKFREQIARNENSKILLISK